MSLEDIRARLDAKYKDVDTDLRELDSNLSVMEFVHNSRIRKGVLEVILKPIILVSHRDSTDTVNLGRLIIRVTSDRDFTVIRDTTSERDAHLADDAIHPHVKRGAVCIGNGFELGEALKDNGDISMFVVLMHSFLLQYSNGSPYWRPFIFNPCRRCPHDFECIFCKCKRCGNRNRDSHDCANCSNAGCLSRDAILTAIVDRVHVTNSTSSLDNLIGLYRAVDNFEV